MMPNAFDLTDQVALVTSMLQEAGAKLGLTDREENCASLRMRLSAAVVVAADLADPATGCLVSDAAHRAFAKVDILVCNAGITGAAGCLWHHKECGRTAWPKSRGRVGAALGARQYGFGGPDLHTICRCNDTRRRTDGTQAFAHTAAQGGRGERGRVCDPVPCQRRRQLRDGA